MCTKEKYEFRGYMLHATKVYLIRKSVHRKTEDDILVQIHIESSYHDVHKRNPEISQL